MSDRLISADKLIEAIREEASLFENPVWYSVFLGFVELVNIAPTIEAIPIEQVARMLCKFTEIAPCECGRKRNGWCFSNCDGGGVHCWEHTIKEGWFGDAE